MADDVKVLGGDGSDWLKDELGSTTLSEKLCALVERDHTPGAIIMSPREMMRFLRVTDPAKMARCNEGSGWAFEGVPIYRSWEIMGPAVVSREVFEMLNRATRTELLGTEGQRSNPVLF